MLPAIPAANAQKFHVVAVAQKFLAPVKRAAAAQKIPALAMGHAAAV